MKAIFGAFAPSGDTRTKTFVGRMLADEFFVGNSDIYESEGIIVGAIDGTVLRSGDGSALVLFGTLFLPSGNMLGSEDTFIEEFIPGFEQHNSKFLSNCEGAFCFAYYSARQKQLTLANDPFGNIALFYTINDSAIIFSSRQRPLAQALELPICKESLLHYIRFEQVLGNNSFFEGIERLSVASILTIDSTGRKNITRYFTPSYAYVAHNEIPEVLAELQQTLVDSVRNQISKIGSVGVALTGGFDSRITLALVRAAGLAESVGFFTHGLENSYDVMIAKKIASSLGLRHTVCLYDEQLIHKSIQYVSSVVAQSEGALGVDGAIMFESWKYQQANYSTMLDSQSAPIYRRTILKARLGAIGRERSVAVGILKFIHSPLWLSQYLNESVKKDAEMATLHTFDTVLSAFPDTLTTGDVIDRFYIEQMCNGHYAQEGNVQLEFLHFLHPLLTPKAYELLSKLPTAFRSKNLIYHYLLNTIAPELKKFPLDNSGYNVPYNGYRWKRYIPQGYDRLLRKLGASLHKKHTLQRPLITQEAILRSGEQQMRMLLEECLPLMSEYIVIAELEKKLHDNTPIPANELFPLTNLGLLLKYLSGT